MNTLAEAVGLSQSALSQHLARMRDEGIVTFRRESQTIWYRIADPGSSSSSPPSTASTASRAPPESAAELRSTSWTNSPCLGPLRRPADRRFGRSVPGAERTHRGDQRHPGWPHPSGPQRDRLASGLPRRPVRRPAGPCRIRRNPAGRYAERAALAPDRRRPDCRLRNPPGAGCTSGHGVCGIGRGRPRSLVATAAFMATAILTVFITRHVLGF